MGTQSKSALQIFDAAISGAVNAERQSVYGHPFHNFKDMDDLVGIAAKCNDPRMRSALIMICAKVSRLVNNPQHLDSWIDIAGYARAAVMSLDYAELMTDDD